MTTSTLSALISKSLRAFGGLGDIFVDGDREPAVAAAKNLQFLAQKLAATFDQEKGGDSVGVLRATDSTPSLSIAATFDVDGSISPVDASQSFDEHLDAWVFRFPSGAEVPVKFFPSDEHGSDPRWIISHPDGFYSELVRIALLASVHQHA